MTHLLKKSLLLAAVTALAACGTSSTEDPHADGAAADAEGRAPAAPDANGPTGEAPPPSGAAVSPSTEGYRNALSLGVSDDGAPLCSGDVAADTFRYGLCVCGDLAMAGQLVTSSFHSSDPSAPDGNGGGVGVNGRYASSGGAEIGGSLVVAGDVTPVGEYSIAGELRAGGDASVVGEVHVEQDAYVQGNLIAIGLSVDGTLHTTEPLGVATWVEAGATSVSDFTIDAPCGCDDVLDVAGLVAQAEAENDNAAASLSADALSGFAGESTLTLAPGRYYLSSIQAAGDVVIVVSGPTALYVGGDVSLAGRLEVVLENDSAELDLFLGGSLGHAGQLELGSAEAPARVRTYVAGGGNIAIAGDAVLGGALYAPNARLAAAGDLTFNGAVLVGSVADAGRINVRYDADLQDADEGCEPTDDPPADDGADDGVDDGAADDDVGADDGAGDDGEPADGEGTPADDVPADDGTGEPSADGSCESFMDCASPLQCIEGSCLYVEG